MGVSTSLHFIGKDSVLEAYRNRDVAAWSLWQHKQFLTKGMSEAELEAFLSSLWDETTAIYTLKVYEDIDDIKKVKEKTECDGSFNFRLKDRDDPYVKGGLSGYGSSAAEKRLQALEEKFELFIDRQLEAEEQQEPEEAPDMLGTIGKFFGNMFNDPDKFEKTVGVIKSLLQPQPIQPAQIGNVNILETGNVSLSPSNSATMNNTHAQQQREPVKELTQEELQRLYTAIETLQANDKDIVQHMEKLAAIAVSKPAQFKTLTGMLDVF